MTQTKTICDHIEDYETAKNYDWKATVLLKKCHLNNHFNLKFICWSIHTYLYVKDTEKLLATLPENEKICFTDGISYAHCSISVRVESKKELEKRFQPIAGDPDCRGL